MRPPPPVLIDAKPGGAWVAAQLLLATLAGATFAAWVSSWWVLGAAIAGLVALRYLDRRCWQVGWTGSAWQIRRLLPAAHANGEWLDCAVPEIKIDLDAWLLLRVQPVAGGRLWIAASAAHAGSQWKPWCAALYWSAEHRSPESRPTDV
jgi:hypothetical protein